jgi:hypothetical protein
MHDPVLFDQGGIDADFSRDNPDQVLELRMAKQVLTRHGALTGSHRALEEFLGPRFHIRAHRGESAFRGLAR